MRIAVYARVSTEHEAQINALENQLEKVLGTQIGKSWRFM